MTTTECNNCIGSRATECAATISAAVLGFNQIEAMSVDTDIAINARDKIISNIVVSLEKTGCLLSRDEVAQKIRLSQGQGNKYGR